MTDDVLIIGLRLGVVLVLYLFLLTLVVLTQRELHREAARAQASTQRARLVVVDPGTAAQAPGQVIPLDPVTRLGRASDQTVVLDDEFVSGAHAIVVFRNGRWWVRDEGSTNGTLLNGVRIEADTALEEGDEIQIGQVVLRLAQ